MGLKKIFPLISSREARLTDVESGSELSLNAVSS